MDDSEIEKILAERAAGAAALERHLSRDNFPEMSDPWLISLFIGTLVGVGYEEDDEAEEDEDEELNLLGFGPEPDPAELAARRDEYHSLLGRFVIEWGGLELALDLLVLQVFCLCDVAPLDRDGVAVQVPRALEARINFLKDAHRLILALKPLRGRASELLKRVTAVKRERHLLVHGVLQGMDTRGNATLIQMSYRKDGYSASFRRITPKRLEHLIGHSRQTAASVMRYHRALLTEMKASEANQPPSEIR